MMYAYFVFILFASTLSAQSHQSVLSRAVDDRPRIIFRNESGTSIAHIIPGQRVTTTLENLRPNAKFVLKARWKGCQSEATFVSDASGRIDLSRDRPVEGSYRNADADGPFWSMDCSRATEDSWDTSDDVSFELLHQGTSLAKRTLQRSLNSPEIVQSEVTSNGLRGTLFKPQGRGPFPTLLTLGGSEGGRPSEQAAYWASKGYAVLALAYFGEPGLPQQLRRIPLEYFKKAIDWLKERSDCNTDRLTVMGHSRGGELALLLGATFPEIKSVVALVPSGTVWPAISNDNPPVSAWTYQGKDIPFVSASRDYSQHFQETALPGGGRALIAAPSYLQELRAAPNSVKPATIAIERLQGPALIISAGADQLWPSESLSQLASERLRNRLPTYGADSSHSFPQAGHSLSLLPGRPTTFPYYSLPGTSALFALGGTPEANALAQRNTLEQIEHFLSAGRHP